jgi:hypothetical protein
MLKSKMLNSHRSKIEDTPGHEQLKKASIQAAGGDFLFHELTFSGSLMHKCFKSFVPAYFELLLRQILDYSNASLCPNNLHSLSFAHARPDIIFHLP